MKKKKKREYKCQCEREFVIDTRIELIIIWKYNKVVLFYFCYDYKRLVSYFFFFSSRRRHTRWPRDWSSDVCSSDPLERLAEVVLGLAREADDDVRRQRE